MSEIEFVDTTRSFGGGDGVIGINNATAFPTSDYAIKLPNPVIVLGDTKLWVEDGCLRWQGPSGKVHVLADDKPDPFKMRHG